MSVGINVHQIDKVEITKHQKGEHVWLTFKFFECGRQSVNCEALNLAVHAMDNVPIEVAHLDKPAQIKVEGEIVG